MNMNKKKGYYLKLNFEYYYSISGENKKLYKIVFRINNKT